VRISLGEQAFLHASAEAAAAAMIAHQWRQTTGAGQHVDVSVQEAVAWTLSASARHYEISDYLGSRRGTRTQTGRIIRQHIFPCKNGYVTFLIQPGAIGAKPMRALVDWMAELGMAGELKDMDFENLDMHKITQEQIAQMEKTFTAFFLRFAKEELLVEGTKRRFLVYPVNRPSDLRLDEQLRYREFFATREDPRLGVALAYQRPFLRGAIPARDAVSPAPQVGEHNRQVYQRLLGLSGDRVAELEAQDVV